MALWRKVIYSGSNAVLNSVTASFQGNGSGITGIVSSSYALSASYAPSSPSVSASYAATASVGGGIYGSDGIAKSNVVVKVIDTLTFDMTGSGGFNIDDGFGNNIFRADASQITFRGLEGGIERYKLDLFSGGPEATFTDSNPTPYGLQYAGDYGNTIKTNLRSFPDVGTIRTYLTASFAISASYAPGSPSVSASFANTAMTASYVQETKSVGLTIDGGGSAITTGIKGDITIPFAGYINAWYLTADQAGSIVIDVWKDTFANFPPTVADRIAGTEKPTLSGVAFNSDTSLTTWTGSVGVGDVIRFNVDSAATVTRVNLVIKILT